METPIQPPVPYLRDLVQWVDIKATLAAVFGAIVGGGASYWGSRALDNSKQKKLTLRLYSLLLLELLDHHERLGFEIDQFLPSWLRRGESFLSGTNAVVDLHFKWLHLRLPKLADEYYSRFLSDLIHADLIVELASYYRDIRNHNRKVVEWNPERAIDDVRPYVQNVRFLFQSGRALIHKLRETHYIKDYFVAAHKSALTSVAASEAKNAYLLALMDLRMMQLSDLETAKKFEEADEEMRDRLEWVGAKVPDTSDIPEFIRNDPNRLWERYLKEASQIGQHHS